MKIFGLAGLSGSGKTTLLCQLLPLLLERGLRVSTIKHAHHNFDVDTPGKDSYRHRENGAAEVVISSKNRWVIIHENRSEQEAELETLLPRMSPVDLVLVEGFKSSDFAKIFLHRTAFQHNITLKDLHPFNGLVAIATDTPTAIAPDIGLPLLDLDDTDALIECILSTTGLS